ncbi:hypothetical protein SLS56_011109 [Neofusicoccum ribis]|uniref:Uncharacterized protein n=1 Tax=Neofusicoccum ribis TaxID=45134 RepID=A0ABR3SCJ5_9PEZI
MHLSATSGHTVQACPHGQRDFGAFLPDGAAPPAYALAPIQRARNDSHPSVALYLSVRSALREFSFADGEAWNVTGLDCKETVFPSAFTPA